MRATTLAAQDLPRGEIIDTVTCAGDATQSYALYVPPAYSPDRPASLLIAFHPAARGRAIVETYRAAAEAYGYVVAGSNNSRNGPWEPSIASLKAMLADIGRRLSIDPNRVYMTGMSGGARVALQIGLGSKAVAGVIASSAGYPDSEPRKSLSFVVFATAGTEDFNYLEMRLLDRALTTPHRLAVFDGGHTLPPAAVALEAVEWLELQAMKSGRRTRDDAVIDRLFAKRQAAIAAATSPAETVHLLRDLADDFSGLRDVSAAAKRAEELSKQKDVKAALARERADDDAELRLMTDASTLESKLRDDDAREDSLAKLRELLSRCALQAASPSDSPERRRARRVLRSITAGAAQRIQDREYLELLERYRQSPGRRPL